MNANIAPGKAFYQEWTKEKLAWLTKLLADGGLQEFDYGVAMALRISMENMGWHSEDRLTKSGWAEGAGYSIWFTRWKDWDHRPHDRASFHASTPNPLSAHLAVFNAAISALSQYNGMSTFEAEIAAAKEKET